jgi:opacity protein-like surface antigen
MKKILLSACMLSMSAGLFAQISKGAMALTGIIGFNGGKSVTEQTTVPGGAVTTTNDQKNKGRIIMPAFSYFVTDMIEAGVFVALTKTTQVNEFPATNPFDQKTRENVNPLTAFGVFGNYYLKTAGPFNCYAGLQFGMGSGTGEVTTTLVNGTSTVVKTKNNGSTFGLNSGFIYFVKSNIALNINFALLSFNSTKAVTTGPGFETETKNSNWAFGVNGIIVNLGLKMFFGNTGAPPAAAAGTTP